MNMQNERVYMNITLIARDRSDNGEKDRMGNGMVDERVLNSRAVLVRSGYNTWRIAIRTAGSYVAQLSNVFATIIKCLCSSID